MFYHVYKSSKLTITHACTMNKRILENKSELKGLGVFDEHLKALPIKFLFSPNDSPSKTMKNVFYFI